MKANNKRLCTFQCYLLHDEDQNNHKRSTKGIHRDTELELNDFHTALYNMSIIKTTENRFNFNKKMSQMTLITQSKPAINPNLTKLRVCDNLVSVEPLKQNSKYI